MYEWSRSIRIQIRSKQMEQMERKRGKRKIKRKKQGGNEVVV